MGVRSDKVGERICTALGIPVDKVDAISIHLRTGHEVEVYVECKPSLEAMVRLAEAMEALGVKVDMAEMGDVVKRYQLVQLGE